MRRGDTAGLRPPQGDSEGDLVVELEEVELRGIDLVGIGSKELDELKLISVPDTLSERIE